MASTHFVPLKGSNDNLYLRLSSGVYQWNAEFYDLIFVLTPPEELKQVTITKEARGDIEEVLKKRDELDAKVVQVVAERQGLTPEALLERSKEITQVDLQGETRFPHQFHEFSNLKKVFIDKNFPEAVKQCIPEGITLCGNVIVGDPGEESLSRHQTSPVSSAAG